MHKMGEHCSFWEKLNFSREKFAGKRSLDCLEFRLSDVDVASELIAAALGLIKPQLQMFGFAV